MYQYISVEVHSPDVAGKVEICKWLTRMNKGRQRVKDKDEQSLEKEREGSGVLFKLRKFSQSELLVQN